MGGARVGSAAGSHEGRGRALRHADAARPAARLSRADRRDRRRIARASARSWSSMPSPRRRRSRRPASAVTRCRRRSAPVSLRLPQQAARRRPTAGRVAVRRRARRTATPLLEASAAHRRSRDASGCGLRAAVAAAALAVFAVTILLLAGPLLDRRDRARARRGVELQLTAGDRAGRPVRRGAALAGVRACAVGASRRRRGPRVAAVLGGATAAAVAAALVSAAVRLRLALRAQRRGRRTSAVALRRRAARLRARCSRRCSSPSSGCWAAASIRPRSICATSRCIPWTASRLATLAGILFGHAAVLWFGALACVLAVARWRLPRRVVGWHVTAAALWIAPTAAVAAIGARARLGRSRAAPIVLGALTCAVGGARHAAARRLVPPRHRGRADARALRRVPACRRCWSIRRCTSSRSARCAS